MTCLLTGCGCFIVVLVAVLLALFAMRDRFRGWLDEAGISIPGSNSAQDRAWEDPARFRALMDRAARKLAQTRPEVPGDLKPAFTAYRNWDFTGVLRLLGDDSSSPLAVYMRARAMGYAGGRYQEAYDLLRAALKQFPDDPLLWHALTIAARNGPDTLIAPADLRSEVESLARDGSLKEFTLGQMIYYEAVRDPNNPDRARLKDAADRLCRAVSLDPSAKLVDCDYFDFLISCLAFLGAETQVNDLVRALLIDQPEIANRWNLELDLSVILPNSGYPLRDAAFAPLRDQLGNHPCLVLARVSRAAEGERITPEQAASPAAEIEAVLRNMAATDYPRVRQSLLYKLGFFYCVMHDLDRALATYRRLQAVSPDYASVHDSLRYIFQSRQDYPAAVAEALKNMEVNHRGRERTAEKLGWLIRLLHEAQRPVEAVQWGAVTVKAMDAKGARDTAVIAILESALRDPRVENNPELQPARTALREALAGD